MTTHFFTENDERPDLTGTLVWNGTVDTDGITDMHMIANGSDTGPFTGNMVSTGGVSGDPVRSTKTFIFDVTLADTVMDANGPDRLSYELCARVTHADGKKETVKLDATAVVERC